MEFIDIVDFDFSDSIPTDYGFSKFLRVGKDIFLYNSLDKNPRYPSIITTPDKKKLVQHMRSFDFIYLPNYEADVEIITSVVKRDKKFIIAISDLIEKKGSDRAIALYRIRKFLKFCISYRAKFVFVSFAKSIYGVRTPKELESIATLLDLLPQQVSSAMRID